MTSGSEDVDAMHLRMLRGNRQAYDFLTTMFNVLHFWDDLIDRERELDPVEINRSMWDALITIPENPFYCQNFASLMPVLKVAIFNWHAANAMERSEDSLDKQIAFVLRSTYVDLVTVCAYIVGGRDWAAEVALEARRQTSGEGFENYLAALGRENRKD